MFLFVFFCARAYHLRMPSSPITDIDIARAFVCPHWPYWERFGDPTLRKHEDEASAHDLFEHLWMERELINTIAPDAVWIEGDSHHERAERTLAHMRMGTAAIAKPCLEIENRVGCPSLLVRTEGSSVFGSWAYAPIDIRRALTIRKEEAFRLSFYGDLLQALQGTYPAFLRVVNRDGERFEADPDVYAEDYRDFMKKLERTIEGECPLPVYRKGCEDTSPWGDACRKLAAERDDIALLFSITQKQMEGLRSQGVETVHQMADIDPVQLDGSAPGLTLRSLLRLQRQSRALIDQSVLVREPWPEQDHATDVFFDIESHPATDQDYLYGFLVRPQDEAESWHAFHTLDGSSEEQLWNTFLAFIPTLPPDYRVYHYGDYEHTRLMTLATRYKTVNNPWLEQFLDRMIDVKEIVRDCLILPLFFYSLKTVAGFLEYRWREDIRHGRDSVREYELWYSNRNPRLAERLLSYNEDDVRATAHIIDWARAWARSETTYLPPYPWKSESGTLEGV